MADDRRAALRKQFISHGLDGRSDQEALEHLLGFAFSREGIGDTAQRLMDRFGSLHAVFAAPVEELARIPGMNMNAAVLIKLVPQVYRRGRASLSAEETLLDSTQRLGEFFVDLLAVRSREAVFEVCLDRRGRLLACHKLAEGDAGQVSLSIRRVVQNALDLCADSVALAHNHPSGIAIPSGNDTDLTRQVQQALNAVGVRLMDHIIVADDDFVSLRSSGLIPPDAL